MALAIEEEGVRIGWFAIDRYREYEADASPAPREEGTNDSRNAAGRPLAVVGVGAAVAREWLVRQIEGRFPWVRVQALRMTGEARSEWLERVARLGLANRFWPMTLHPDAVLSGALDHSKERIHFSVDGIDLRGLRLPLIARARVMRSISERLSGVGVTRKLNQPALIRLTGPLMVESLAFDPGLSRFEVRVEEAR